MAGLMMVDNSYPVAKTLSKATGSIFIGWVKQYNYCWLISGWLDDWLTGGTNQEEPVAFIFSEGLQKRSLECLYDLWLAGILIWGSLDHIECHVGAFGPCDWPYGNLGSSWGIFTASTSTDDASRCFLVCSECSINLLEHMLIYLASDWVIYWGC